MIAVESRGLTCRFGATLAVDRLDLSVESGEIFGLVGPDGAGKTTTLRMMVGAQAPTSGTALVNSVDVVDRGDDVRARIGYTAQRFALYGDLTVAENLSFAANVYGVPRRVAPARADELLVMAGLSPFRARLADHLSGGMKQKLALACALIHRPDVVFLDEPTTGVDPVSRRDLWRMLYRLQSEGLTIVVATAYMDEAERCHRLALMNGGRALSVGSPGALRAAQEGTIVAVHLREAGVGPLLRARAAATGLSGVRGAQLFGDRLHVVVDRAEQQSEVLAAIARVAEVTRAERVEPTMEDVFLSLRAAA